MKRLTSPPIIIRPAIEDDFPFIRDSWVHSSWDDHRRRKTDVGRFMPEWGYKHMLRELIGDWWRNPYREDDDLRVAASADDHSQILGWICADGYLVRYMYVKEVFRGMGIAHHLMAPLLVWDDGDTLHVTQFTIPLIDWRRRGRKIQLVLR